MGNCRGKPDVIETDEFGNEKKEYSDSVKPDIIRKDIQDYYKLYLDKKISLEPLFNEKYGLQAILDEERERLIGLISKKESLLSERDSLLVYTWERDADDIYRAFGKFSLDKTTLVNIIINRTKWQMKLINDCFERKYGRTLLEFIVNEMTTMIGTLATGGNTGLSKLLTYRIMSQPERDAAFLRDFSDGMSLDDENFIEIITTRTNEELRYAIDLYKLEYKKDLLDIVKNKTSYKNFREFVLKILECQHDESNKPFDTQTAIQYAQELYEGGIGRTLGIDPEPFLRILSNINYIQFESINNVYKDQKLVKDISTKLGGSFESVVLARISDKYVYLASKIEKALRGFSVDKEVLCRIFGSFSRTECIKIREAYNRSGYNRTLDEALKSTLSKGNFQKALLDLIFPNPELNPIGTERELVDDEKEAYAEGERAKSLAENNYKVDKIILRGEVIRKEKRKLRKQNITSNSNHNINESNHDTNHENIDINIATSETNILDPNLDDPDDDIPKYTWDPIRGRFMDVQKLVREIKDCQTATTNISLLKERLIDEINATKEIYYSMVKSCVEAEAWIRILNTQLKQLKEFIEKRDVAAAKASKKSK
mmetsp:Transcript_6253/g.5586  ORF Transcript_6253/g.5586 Transcript_6253/m.5586 type:complete len:600 (+) Transcript_6253:141-1940(+)